MVGWARSCLQSALKLMNSVIGLAGMGMILYSLWMIRSWYKDIGDGYSFGADSSPPWFIYTFLGLGIFLCLITCVGHIAAETANSHCLSCDTYSYSIRPPTPKNMYIMVEQSGNWEEDFPEDPTGKFDELKQFVILNYKMCKWMGLLIVAAQALSIITAMVLKALGPDYEIDYDSDDSSVTARLPLLRNQVLQTGNHSVS